MNTRICNQSFKASLIFIKNYLVAATAFLYLETPILLSQESSFSIPSYITGIDSFQVIYRNPRVYNVEISFEINPDRSKIDRDKDLKVWIPIPREWDSQKNVQIISVQPEPHSQFTDPEYGNKIFYWDFGKYPEKPSYRVDIKARMISYSVRTTIDPSCIKPYDKTSKEYELYTKSGYTIHITPKVKELTKESIGNETNPYLKAQKILTFVYSKKWYLQTTRFDQGMNSSLDYMISNSYVDKSSGKEYFTGDCAHYSALFVTMCRSEGIPARCVYGRIGWAPYLNEGNSKMFSKLDTMLTDDGFAGAQHHGLTPHMWAEFYLPDYGWIPADPNAGRFGQLNNNKVIMSKGRDIDLGPYVARNHHDGYGYQWVPIYDGRVDGLLSAVYNIEKICKAKSSVYHTLDPFPADGLTEYIKIFVPTDNNQTPLKWRNGIISEIDYNTRDIPDRDMDFSKIYYEPNWLRYTQYKYDAFICHMLHKVMGDEKFLQLITEYERLLINSPVPIQTDRFIQMAGDIYGESLEWFFGQWEKTNGLPHMKLDNVEMVKDKNGWSIKGNLIQSGKSFFTLPVKFSLETEKGKELFTIWQRGRITDFEFQTVNKPSVLKADPDHDILKLQRMPLQLSRIWDSYPDITLIYGTVSESEANKTAAKQFNNEYLGLSPEIIKPDTSITDNDLNTECVVLFGRPETNKITKRFNNIFPIKLNRDNFSCNGINYSKTSQGLAQITEHPLRPKGQFILYAGLSPSAMLQFGDLYLYDAPSSFMIYDAEKQITSGDWADTDSELVWEFEK